MRHAVIAVLFWSLAWAQGESCPEGGNPGRWSTAARDLCPKPGLVDFTRNLRIFSPDHRGLLQVIDSGWSVRAAAENTGPATQQGIVGYPAEVAWSSDSAFFYLTQSEGNISGFRTQIYSVRDQRDQPSYDINKIVRQDFDRKHRCKFYYEGRNIGPDSNIAGFKWVDGDKQIVIIAEVPPEGLCQQSSYFEGYQISLSDGRIAGHYDPEDLFKRWGPLFGERLIGDLDTVRSRRGH